MLKKVMVCLVLVGVLCGCDSGSRVEKALLERKKAALQSELEKNRKTIDAMMEIGQILDSIDKNRAELVYLLEENPSFRDYNSRLLAINSYVMDTQLRIYGLEEKMTRLNEMTQGYAGTIQELKQKVDRRTRELEKLKVKISHFQTENQNLYRNVSYREDALTDSEEKLRMKEMELKILEVRVEDARERISVAQGMALYGEAISIEEKANRTHFAPEKKKGELRSALELYRRSAALGNEDAPMKVAQLERKLQ